MELHCSINLEQQQKTRKTKVTERTRSESQLWEFCNQLLHDPNNSSVHKLEEKQCRIELLSNYSSNQQQQPQSRRRTIKLLLLKYYYYHCCAALVPALPRVPFVILPLCKTCLQLLLPNCRHIGTRSSSCQTWSHR